MRSLKGDKMQIKINYTVDIEKVPSRAQKLLDEASEELVHLSSELPAVESLNLDEVSLREVHSSIDKVRRKMFILDSRFADVLTILEDWRKTSLILEVQKLSASEAPSPKEDKEEVSNENV